MNTKYNLKYILRFGTIFLGFYLFFHPIVFASIISISAPKTTLIGERIYIDVLVDPQEKSINSIESIIKFDKNYFSFNGFSAEQSSIPIWVEEPKEKHPPAGGGEVHFSGVIPGGIDRLFDPINANNTSIPIVRLYFLSKKTGDTDFQVGSSQVLENDGKGTSTSILTKDTSIAINGKNDNNKFDQLASDTLPPNPFTINIVDRSVFGKTPRLAVFSADDENGGIEHYEIAVGNLGFQKVASPFALPYRLFPYTLIARAYDYSGNYREQQIVISGEKPYGIGLVLLLAVLCLLAFRFYRRVKRT